MNRWLQDMLSVWSRMGYPTCIEQVCLDVTKGYSALLMYEWGLWPIITKEVLSLGSTMGFYFLIKQVYVEVAWDVVHLSIKDKWLKCQITIMSYVD